MSKLPDAVHRSLLKPVYKRQEKEKVKEAFEKLGVNVLDVFKEFFETYQGPFRSSNTGFELVDLFDIDPNIISLTQICREQYGFPKKFLVLTDLLGGGAIAYDTEKDYVFNIDFEGTEQDLILGKLNPDWISFYDFLNYYFG